jgi:hypothetical protein
MVTVLARSVDNREIAQTAVEYARRGWRVIPLHYVRVPGEQPECSCFRRTACHGAGKHPLIKSWRVVASNDPDLVCCWWRARPLANIGIAMGGPARLIAIDIDGEEGRASLAKIESAYGPLPLTLAQTTGRLDGGEHRLFTLPDNFDIDRIRNRVKIAPGIDVRAEGGLIVAAPSLHSSGSRYMWRDPAAPIAGMPNWLIALATSQKARQVISENAARPTEEELQRDGYPLARRYALAREKLIHAEPAIQGRNGSGACLRATCLLIRGYCLPPEHAFELLWHVYNLICVPPWSESELMHKIESAEYAISDASYPWRFMIPAEDPSPPGRVVDAIKRAADRELNEAERLAYATPETNPTPLAGIVEDNPARRRPHKRKKGAA